MVMYTHLEDQIYYLYQYYQLPRCPSIETVAEACELRVIFNAPASYIQNEIILLERSNPEKERERFAHELSHYFRDIGGRHQSVDLYHDYIEFTATSFMYHFLVPTFLLEEDSLPFCRDEAISYMMHYYKVTRRFARRRLEMYERRLIDVQYYYE